MPSWLMVLIGFSALSSLLITAAVEREALSDYFINGVRYEEGFEVVLTLIGLLVLNLALYFIFLRQPLVVRMNPEGIHYFCFPYLRRERSIGWREIENADIVEIHPLTDFGGWGYRMNWGKKKRGYVMKGGPALRVIKKSDSIERIFTINDPEKAMKTIEHYTSNKL